MFSKKIDIILIISLGIYLILLIPYITEYPFLDADLHFQQAYDLYTGGLQKFFIEWENALHPPGKPLILTLLFYIFGVNVITNTLLGISTGLIGVLSIYLLTKYLYNIKSARLSAFILSAFPLYVSTGLFAHRDFLISIILIVSTLFYLKEKFFLHAITASFAVLLKETALAYTASIILTEIFFINFNKNSQEVARKTILLLPFFILLAWLIFLNINHQQPWNDNIFTDNPKAGSLYTILITLLTGKILNIYFVSNLAHLFILNFNYIYWVILLLGVIKIIIGNTEKKIILKRITNTLPKAKTIIASITFMFVYTLAVLSFPTYSIPRYILPIIPYLVIFISITISLCIKRKISKIAVYILIGSILFIGLFYSQDPISKIVWGNKTLFGEDIYNFNFNITGTNGMTYNYQFFKITHKRNSYLKLKNWNIINISKEECNLTFKRDHDHKLRKILNINLKTINCEKLPTALQLVI